MSGMERARAVARDIEESERSTEAKNNSTWPRLPADKRCDPGCPGWAIFNSGRGLEIQRCDECGRFEGDEDATQYGLAALRELQLATAKAVKAFRKRKPLKRIMAQIERILKDET